jgi:hypothetical protein
MKITNNQISRRFINGLAKYDLTIDDLKNFYYIGNDNDSNLKNKINHESYCICGHRIKTNNYITDGNIILIIGLSCIQKFLPYKKQRLCPECMKPTRNRIKTKLCNSCKMKTKEIKGNFIITF